MASRKQLQEFCWNRVAGFNLIELVVVIACVTIMTSLLLCGVQFVRSTARRISCTNNLKQVGLAVQMHHDTFSRLPSGTCSTIGPKPHASWIVQILPFIEESARSNQIDQSFQLTRNPFSPSLHPNLTLPLATVSCPADARTSQSQVATRYNLIVGTTAYLGVNGTNQVLKDGLLFYDSKIKLRDITDGLSNTLLVGERPPSRDFTFGWWYAGIGSESGALDHTLGSRELTIGFFGNLCELAENHFHQPFSNSDCNDSQFWSRHSSGANFCFADGSVRFMPYSYGESLELLSTRAGSEIAYFDP